MPIVDELLNRACQPILGAYGRSMKLLEKEYPQLEIHELPGFEFTYSSRTQHWGLLRQLPGFLRSIKEEHIALERFVKEHEISGVISDNRYGLWSEKVPSVLLSHQFHPIGLGLTKYLESMAAKRIRKMADRFSFVWLPDNKAHTLSGALSEERELWDSLRYVGVLSRFSEPVERPAEHDILVVLSGQEPARSEFDRRIMSELSKLKGKRILVIRGLPDMPELEIKGNINVKNFLSSDELQKAILSSRLVISRSGYSSIMDYARLGVKAAFIPTPGQTEQLYLAQHLMDAKIAPFQEEKEMNLSSLVAGMPYFHGFKLTNAGPKLDGPLKEFLRRV